MIIAVLVVLASAVPTAAETAEALANVDKPYIFEASRKLKLSCLAADSGIASLWIRTMELSGGAGTAAIVAKQTSAPYSKRSSIVSYQGPAKIEFFETQPPPGPPFDEQGNRQGPQPIAIADLPSEEREVLLLFIPLPKDHAQGSLHYRVIPFDDSQDKLPWGAYRLVNFTNRPLIAFAGSKELRFDLQPNTGSSTIRPGGDKRNLQWMIYDPAKGSEKPVFSAQWLHRPNYRSLVFLTDSRSQQGALSVKSIDEWMK